MRKSWAILLLAAAACTVVPQGQVGRRPVPAPSQDDPRVLRQCLGDLGGMGVRYELLPDRVFSGGCTATGSVKLVSVGIPVTNLGAMKCGLARAFALWTRESVQQAARAWLDGYVVRIESFGTYACRPVNGQSGNRLSEHGRSNAVDIAAFVLADGRRITVKDGWNGPDENVRRFLRAVHGAGCRRFAIVLGPDANRFHHDHLHFDMGRGPYCR